MLQAFTRSLRIVYRFPMGVLLLVFGTALIIATFLLLFVVIYAIAGLAFVLFPVSLVVMYLEGVAEKDGEPFPQKVTGYLHRIGRMLRSLNPGRVMTRYIEECGNVLGWMLDKNSWDEITERASGRNRN